jgi:hypothetical protein
MSYIKTILKKIDKTLDLSKKENREMWRDRADVYVSAKEKSMSPELILDAAVELGIMSYVEYKGKKYPTRQIQIKESNDDCEFTAVIASEKLCEAYGNPDEVDWDENAQSLDAYIYFYVSPELMLKDAQEIAEEHLDEPFDLITEIF